MGADEHGAAEVSGRPVTFEAAMKLGGFELAKQWADRLSWPFPTERTARDDLAELAYMSALAEWLRLWQPIHIHRALLADASLLDMLAAMGSSLDETFCRWYDWAASQRPSKTAGIPGITDEEYRKVMRAFTAAGATSW